MIIYHGSKQIVSQPVYGGGKTHNDYGTGFYCTETLDLANEWACAEESSGYANRYQFDMEGLTCLNLNNGDYHILNWLAILLENRTFRTGGNVARAAKAYILEKFMVPYKQYDVIRGYRADDSYFSFASAFINNTISLSQLSHAMMLGKLGEQIVLKSRRSFERIHFETALFADAEVYYPRKKARDDQAQSAFRAEQDRGFLVDEVYILDILRERWDDNDSRLQRMVFE